MRMENKDYWYFCGGIAGSWWKHQCLAIDPSIRRFHHDRFLAKGARPDPDDEKEKNQTANPKGHSSSLHQSSGAENVFFGPLKLPLAATHAPAENHQPNPLLFSPSYVAVEFFQSIPSRACPESLDPRRRCTSCRSHPDRRRNRAGVQKRPGTSRRESPILPSTLAPSSTPVASISAAPSDAGKSPAPGKQVAANPEELGQTLEEFQAEYESLSGKGGGEEAFFKKSVGKKVAWTVRVDHVFRAGAGVIVVFSSTERPDWAAFPISDARFPVRLEKQLMTLSRGDIIRIEGKIVYRGIKTLECSHFEIVRSETPSD